MKIIGKLIVGLWLVLWYFGKAAWTGEVFPITAGGRIYDHGRQIGWIGGGRSKVIGRLLAILVLSVFNAGMDLGVFSAFVFLVLGAYVGVLTGYLDNPAGDDWMWAVDTAAGVAGTALLIVMGNVIYHRKIEGLKTLLPKMFGFNTQQQPKQEQPKQPLVVVERTLLERLVAGFEDLAEGIDRFFGDR